jgi:hypothetical protein
VRFGRLADVRLRFRLHLLVKNKRFSSSASRIRHRRLYFDNNVQLSLLYERRYQLKHFESIVHAFTTLYHRLRLWWFVKMRLTTSAFALKALTISLAVGSADAFWRMPCRSRSGLARVDPLVSFGTVSEHAHAIHGSSGMFTPPNAAISELQTRAQLRVQWI